jgi:SOS-response transcriptional repressor LexA
MPDFSTLTSRQREIYDFIRQKIEARGYGPTVREIGSAFEIRSPNGVMCHLKALEKKGLIKREGFSAYDSTAAGAQQSQGDHGLSARVATASQRRR